VARRGPTRQADWNAEIKTARLDGPLALGARARIVFRTGLRLRFSVVEFEQGRLFTDEARLPGARMGHRHLVEPGVDGGSRLTSSAKNSAAAGLASGPDEADRTLTPGSSSPG